VAKKKAAGAKKTDSEGKINNGVAGSTPAARSRKVDPDLSASRALARKLARLADDRHCREIVILELERISPIAKHFVIGTGTSDQQIRSIAREMQDVGERNKFKTFGAAGMQQGRWVVLDMVDIVVHLFDEEYRKFYDLELLWGDAPKLRWQRTRPKKSNENA
jgi:ribosome-associated protein